VRVSLLMAGLMATLAGTAVLAQTIPTPDDSTTSTEAPDARTSLPEARIDAPPMRPTPVGAQGNLSGAQDPHSGLGVPGLAPLATYDVDGDGTITEAEIEARKAERFEAADADGDGALSPEELIAMEAAIREEARQVQAFAHAIEVVTRMDDNRDGLLQAGELEARTPRLAPLFDQFDTNNDGGISQAEREVGHAGRDSDDDESSHGDRSGSQGELNGFMEGLPAN
jgi:Ca2+-binding EF-hand superfamily protein